jgi:hypothetical protein
LVIVREGDKVTRMSLVVGSLLLLLLVSATDCCISAGKPTSGKAEPVSLAFSRGGTTRMPLAYSHVVLQKPDGTSMDTPVVLERVECKISEHRQLRGKRYDGEHSALVYVLRSTDPRTKYSWAVARRPLTPDSIRGFALSSDGKGRNYLAWVEGLDVCIAEVSQPRDIKTAVAQGLNPVGAPRLVRARLTDLLPERDRGHNALFLEVAVQSVARRETGDWAVRVVSQVAGNTFTIVGNGPARRVE